MALILSRLFWIDFVECTASTTPLVSTASIGITCSDKESIYLINEHKNIACSVAS